MKMSKKQQIWSFGMAQSKSRPNLNWDVQDLKREVHAWKPTNVAVLKQFYMEDWAKIPPQQRSDVRDWSTTRKNLGGVIAAKGGTTS